mgnify:CR=1 FL=1
MDIMTFANNVKTAALVVILVAFSTFFAMALAQESTPTPSFSPIDYTLPYPGILPDHPLFFIKNLRDKMLLLLISDPVRKVEFRQLLADKYTAMGVILSQNNKTVLAISAFEKGLMYLNETRKYVLELPASDADKIGNVKNKFKDSLLKHEQVIVEVLSHFSGDEKIQVEKVLESTKALQQEFSS